MSNIHLIGIGGAGLSAIATVLLQQSHQISGSDSQASAATERLAAMGAKVFIGQRAENIDSSLDAVIVSSAIGPDNPELLEARRLGLSIFKRADWLGHMMAGQTGIAVAGTHGKTTTTAMTAFVFEKLGQQPSYIVGGFVPQLDSNAAAGAGRHFVIEADEYDHMFLGLRPEVAIVTIVEWDHPDIFPTRQEFNGAFQDFVRLVPPAGLVIGCGDAPGVREVIAHAQAPVVTYGMQPENDWQAVDLEPNHWGGYDFKATRPALSGFIPVPVSLAVPGVHNVYNAMAVLVAANHQGLDLEQAAAALGQFKGVDRRFQFKGEVDGVTVIDDYAHHPTEVKAALSAARSRFGERPIWAVFQPHTFSRTLTLLADFAHVFDQADHVILVDIYASREKDEGLVSSQDVVNRVAHPDVQYLGALEDTAKYLSGRLASGDVLITMGAGDGYLIGEWILDIKKERNNVST